MYDKFFEKYNRWRKDGERGSRLRGSSYKPLNTSRENIWYEYANIKFKEADIKSLT